MAAAASEVLDGLFAVTDNPEIVGDLGAAQRLPGEADIARVVLDEENLDPVTH